jgi:hypothetical protein
MNKKWSARHSWLLSTGKRNATRKPGVAHRVGISFFWMKSQ